MNRGTLLALSVVLATGVSACAKTPVRVPTVALAVPTPPARVLVPVELPEYVAPEPEPPMTELPAPPPPRSATTSRPAPEKPAAPPAADAPPPSAPVLRTTANASALEQKIVGLLGSARQRLQAMNYRELSTASRTHYDQARDFIRMADDALSIKNFEYAEVLAARANALAEGLLR